jgi:hypothetical protein
LDEYGEFSAAGTIEHQGRPTLRRPEQRIINLRCALAGC